MAPTDSLAISLDLLPSPAALYEVDGGLIHANPSAVQFLQTEGIHTFEALLARVAPDHAPWVPRQSTGHWNTVNGAWLHASTIPPSMLASRPELVLVTRHEVGSSGEQSHHDHVQILLALRVNEDAQVALQNMDVAISQIRHGMSVLGDLLESFNGQLRVSLGGNDPNGLLDGLDGSPLTR